MQIAIIQTDTVCSNYDDYDVIVKSISDWSEVTHEEYVLLNKYLKSKFNNYQIIIRKDLNTDFIPTTIKAALEEAKKQQEKQEKLRLEEERKKQERLLKKKAKTELEEKKLLDQLKKKYEDSQQ